MRVALLLIGALVRPLGGLWPFAVGSENQTCDKEGAGSCPTEGHEPFSTRGSEPSPGASYWWFDWSWEGSTEPKASTPQAEDAHSRRWYFRILAGVLWEIWEGGLTWCGTLCASIGLAARWTYWLATTTILLGMLQLTYWTYAWVVRPIIVVIGALLHVLWGTGRACGRWIASWCCCGGAKHSRRAPRPGEEEGRTPRHDLSETESEEEDNPCQADAIAWKEGTQTKRLSKERCKDAACSWVKLLNDDGMQSSSGELHWDGLQASCQLCARHQESYALSKTRRACSVEGCGKVAQTVKGGVKLCRLHASKEERGPTPKPGNFASRSRGPQEARKRSISRGAERARPHSQDATPKRGTQTEAAELRGISSPPRLDGATSVAPFPGVDAAVEDQVLTGLTWEEIAGIPDEDLRKRAIFLKQRGAMPGPTSGGPDRSTSRTEAPDDSQACSRIWKRGSKGRGTTQQSRCQRWTAGPRQRDKDVSENWHGGIACDSPVNYRPRPRQTGGGSYPWSASDAGQVRGLLQPRIVRGLPQPRITDQFRPNPGAGGAGGRTDAVDALAQATRAFRAGAFTDAEAPAADETTKALQAIAKSLTSKEDALAQERGKLASIGRIEERLVFLLRGCDSLSVTLCPGVVGKELFHALRIAGTQARPQLRKIEFPCNIQNRHSYGFAALQLGGKTLNTLPEYCLSAGDFPLTSEEDFDNYGGSPDLKLERKGRYPNTLTSWFRAALRQSWAFACLFGEEYYPVLEKAASHLLRLGEQHGYAWSASAVYGAWEELWARFCEEARELDRRIRRAMQDTGNPGSNCRVPFALTTIPNTFCTDMLPRMQRQLSRACWAGAQKKGNTGGRAAGEGDATEARTEPGEAARSLDHRPKDQQGQYLCWDFLTHRGCNKGNGCPHSRKAAPKWTTLDYTVQLQLLRRGGLKGSKAKTGDEVDREFTRVRAEQAAKAAAAKQEGIAAAKAKVSATQRTNPAAGTGNADRASRAGERVPEQTGHVVADLDNVLPTDREETLGALLKDEGNNWWHDVDAAAATLTCPSSKFEKSARADAMRVVDAAEPALGPYPPGLVGVYLRNRLLRLREETGRAPELEDVTHLLEEAERGVHRKAGESPLVQLSGLTWNSSIGAGTLTWKGVGHWAMYDYQDQLPLSPEACERMGFADVRDEPKQCLLLHVAAAYLATPDQPLPTPEAVWALAAEWRVRWCSQARVAEDSLGPTPERHDRDYRTLVAHPLEEWDCLGLAVLRLDAYMRPSVEVVCGSRYSGKAEDTRWVLVHRGHMRLLVPDESCLPSLGSRELEAAGWEAYLEEAEGSPLLDAGRLLQCQVCHPKRAPGSFRTGREAGAFGLQVPTTSVDWPLLSCLPPAGQPLPLLVLGPSTAHAASACAWGPLPDAAAAAAALAYITEGGVSCLWLLPAALPPGPPADEWSSVLRLAAAQLQTGGRCVLEAPLYRRAWTDKATRIQLADLSEGTGDSVRCGKLFADSGPLLGPPPSWLPKSLSKEAEEAAEAYLRKVHQERVKAEYRGTQRDATRGRVLLMSPGPDEEDLLDGVDDHFPAIQPRYAEVVRLVMWYKSRYPGVRVLLAKKDVSEAFKWLWVEQDDCRLFGADLPTEGATRDSRGDASRPVTVLYLAMTFGWTGAPGEFMAFAWAIKLLHRACGPDRPEWHDSSSFRSLALMDDSVVIEPDLGLRPQLSVDALEEAIRQTLGPLAINAAKDVEEGTLTTRKLIWGLEFDTEAGTCRLPPLKVERAYHVLQSPYFDAGQTKVPLKEVQVLRGSQQFWLGVLPQLAPYLQSTNALLGPADREGHVVLRGNEAEQSAQWEAFWSAIELQRLLVGSRQFWEARFVSQLEHALTTPELLALPEVKRNLVWVSADATPTRLGAIDWTARVAVACAAAPLLSPLEANAQDSTDLEARTEPEEDLVQIGVAELLALLVLVVARKEAWAGSVVLYLGDNTNVQDWLRKRQAGNAQANHLLKVLGALEGVHGLQVRGAYLRTYHNQTADDLTRLDPDKVMEQQRLTRLSVPDDWGRVLEEAWHRRALLWVGQPDSDRQMALQLAARRIGPAPPRAMPAFGWKVHELGASEHGVYTRAFFAAGGLKHDPQDSLATLEGAPTVERSAPGEEETPTQEERLLCVATVTGEAEARRVVSGVLAQAASIWIDSFRPLAVEAICTEDAQNRWEWWTEEFTGRTFKEQVWWHRWVLVGVNPGAGKAGACELPWEDDAEALVRLWLGGKLEGRRDQEKLERLRGSFRARSDADRRRLVKILRHEAALLGLPIREDGWVSLKDLNECVGTISGEDAARIIGRDEKDRLILSQEGEEVWVAAVFFKGVFQATISLSPTWNFPDTVLKKGLLQILKMEEQEEDADENDDEQDANNDGEQDDGSEEAAQAAIANDWFLSALGGMLDGEDPTGSTSFSFSPLL
ncbi:unnamed protein product [Symbiodinium sp. CCMP2592]|nr:unnamed protein product [Symbiodinium sp. CCMP2592]